MNIRGKNNQIFIDDWTILTNCIIQIFGNNNTIKIGSNCRLNGLEIWIEDDSNLVTLEDKVTCQGNVQLACIEGTQVLLGEDCMLSADIVCRTGDSHSIIDATGKRMNPSRSINIGNHVWIGNDVKVLKGVSIASQSIIGSGAVVSKTVSDWGSVVVGNPAKIVKNGVNWDRRRMPIDNS